MEFVLVWLVSAAIAMFITKTNERSMASGFFLGFLLGPIGILIALLMGKKRLEPAGEDESFGKHG